MPLQELFEEKCVQLDRAVEARRAVEDERLTADAVAEEMATELEETLAHNEYLRADYDKLAAEVLQLRHQKSSGVLTVRSRCPRLSMPCDECFVKSKQARAKQPDFPVRPPDTTHVCVSSGVKNSR